MSANFTFDRRLVLPITLIALCLTCSIARSEPADEAVLLTCVQSSDASLHDKAVALEELALRGGPDSVAALAELLDDPRWSHYARYALQANPAPEAGAALRSALDRVHGDRLVGVINSIASLRDQQATAALAKLLQADDQTVAKAAAGALATIGSAEALATLEATPPDKTTEFADALLQAALVRQRRGELDQAIALLNRTADASTPVPVKQAATLALMQIATPSEADAMLASLLASPVEWKFIVALQAAVQAGTAGSGGALSDALATISPDRQARVLSVLATKGEGVSLPAVRAAGVSPHAEVRAAAAAALGALGNGTDGPLLVGLALDDPKSSAAATAALVGIQDQRLDEYLVGMLDSAEPAKQILAANVIGLRQTRSALPELFALAQRVETAEVRLAALGALRRIAPGAALGQVLDLVKDARSADVERLAREAAIEVALRSADQSAAVAAVAERFESWPAERCDILLDVLARVGNADSLQLVAQAADNPDRGIQNQATRVLGAWPTADAAPILLRLASSEHPYAARALRGYLRIARQYQAGEERVEMCRRALELAHRDEERLLSLQILTLTPTPESLHVAATQLSSDRLGARASDAVIAMAEAVAPDSPAAAAAAARAVIQAGGSEEVVARARQLSGGE